MDRSDSGMVSRTSARIAATTAAMLLILSFVAVGANAGTRSVLSPRQLPTDAPTVLPECSDLLDNDDDGDTDHDKDEGCVSLLDNDEDGPSPLCGTPNVVCGGPADNEFVGDAEANTFFGGGGDDHIRGGGGNDFLNGGPGNDELTGQRGNDKVVGGPGADDCSGGPGKDTFKRCESVSSR